MLNRQIGTLVGVIRMKEHLLRFFEADSAPWIPPKALLFRASKWNRMTV
jgi:hypothetical protein